MKKKLIGLAILLALLVPIAVGSVALLGKRSHQRALRTFSDEYGSARLADLVPPEVPEDFNAASWLREAAESFEVDGAELAKLTQLSRTSLSEWNLEAQASGTKLVAAHTEVLSTLKRAAPCERGNFGIRYTDGHQAELPNYLQLLKILKLNLLEGRVALLEGRVEDATTSLAALVAARQTLDSDSLLISSHIVFSVDRMVLDLGHDILASGLRGAHTLDGLDAAFRNRDVLQTLRSGIRGEGAILAEFSAEDMVQTAAGSSNSPLEAKLQAPVLRLMTAETLDGYVAVGSSLEQPWPTLESQFRGGELAPGFWAQRLGLFANLRTISGRAKALELSYVLAVTALDAASGRTPVALPEDPFTGRPLELTVTDEILLVESPTALAIWEALEPTSSSNRPSPKFAWSVSVGS